MRLIDADVLIQEIREDNEGYYFNSSAEREVNLAKVDYALDRIREAPTVEERPTGEWIPVGERLPEDMQRVLVWFEYYRYGDYNCMYQTYGFGEVCDGKWSPFINGETGWQDTRIIAWMPLPKPYKEAEDEKG